LRVAGAERVFIGLGSNLGPREEHLRGALERIARLPGTRVVSVSSVIETAPWGVADQPAFLNAAAELRTELEPEALLDAVKGIEAELGRAPTYRWGPRLIDVDLLLYGDRVVRTERLTLPHPYLLERPFVREPLREIAPEVVEELERAAVSLRGAGPDR
jgi:2-amino-4-hydroxy-6-hydroxymethyldihydropteridine diphosphokinase